MAGALLAIDRRRAAATTLFLDQISQSATAAGLTIECLESPGDGAVALTGADGSAVIIAVAA